MAKQARRTAAAGAALLTAIAVGVATPALAQDASGDDPTTTAESFEQRREEAQQDFAQKLAEKLGIDADRVSGALDAVHEELAEEHAAQRLADLKERLAAAVSEGTLTQEQAAAIVAAHESGVLGGPGELRHQLRGPGGPDGPGEGGGGPVTSGFPSGAIAIAPGLSG